MVFLAMDTTLDRKVAIKRLHGVRDPAADALANLQREAGVVCQLHHPNIVRVLDFGRDADGPFVVMEYHEGTTLHEHIRDEGPMMEGDFLAMARQCLDGLVAAQSQRLLHRDLKPGNVMLDRLPSGQLHATLLDFGLAKFLHQPDTAAEAAGELRGTVYFMAPEQFLRQPLDARTDIYSLGCVFYYALTRVYPFNGENPEDVIKAHLEFCPDSLEYLRPDLSVALCRWVHWLMEREPENRPPHAGAALERLQGLRPAKPKEGKDLDYFYAPDRPLPKVVPLSGTPTAGPGRSGKRKPRSRFSKRQLITAALLLGLLIASGVSVARFRKGKIQKVTPPHTTKTEWFRRPLDATFAEGTVWLRWQQSPGGTLALARGSERVVGVRLRKVGEAECQVDLRLFGAAVESKLLPGGDAHDIVMRIAFGRDEASSITVWTDLDSIPSAEDAGALLRVESEEPLVFDSVVAEGGADSLEGLRLARDSAGVQDAAVE